MMLVVRIPGQHRTDETRPLTRPPHIRFAVKLHPASPQIHKPIIRRRT